jgi:hypothetical protein
MKCLFFTLIVLLSTSQIFAKDIELEISAKWSKGNDIRRATSKVIAKIGEELIIPGSQSEEIKITITADDKLGPQQSVYLNNKIFEVRNGKEILLSNPKVIALLGKTATIYTESSTGEHLELAIKPIEYSSDKKL